MTQHSPYENFDIAQVRPIWPDTERLCLPITLGPSLTLAKGQVLGLAGTAQNHRWTITDTPTITAGTWTYTGRSPLTGVELEVEDLAYNISVADLEDALEEIYGVGNVLVAGGALPGTDVTITLQGDLAGMAAELPTIDSSGLTGGTLAIALTLAGRTGNVYVSVDDLDDGDGKCILPIACTTDAEGLVSFGRTAGGYMGHGERLAWAWFRGDFDVAELVGMTAANLAAMGRQVVGDLTAGVVRIG